MSEKFDVVVIGAGPGGYVAAIKSAKLGMKTAVIEEREVGGTCLNRGCIPAKAMIHASTLYREIKEADRFGISASDVTYDFEKILEYKEQTTVPKSLVIIGGGVISVEFATVYSALGSKVTILEAMPRLVPNMDKEIAQNLKLILKKRGVESHTSAAVQGVHMEGDTCICTFVEKEKEQTVEAEYVLCAVGRCPNTDGLFAEGAAPDMERGRVLVNDKFESSIPGVYAIGDLIFGAQLAHAASAQGIVVAEQLAGKEPSVNLDVVPGCVYTDPEIASAGITEDAAKEQGIKVKTGKFIMSANGKSLITKEERGFIKIVADEETDVILGAQMMCARATDMIGEFVTAIANKMTVAQLLKGMRAHPTYNEGIGEALEEAEGGAIHVVPKKKK